MNIRENQRKPNHFSFNKHPLTPYIFTDGINRVDGMVGDGWINFLDKIDNYNDTWFHHTDLNKMYKYYSIFMHTNFRKIEAPKRCNKSIDHYADLMYKLLKTKHKRVSKSLLKTTIRFVIKHISRLAYHKYYCLRYSRKEGFYTGKKHISYNYLMSFIDYLVEENLVLNLSGFQTNQGKNIHSILVVSKEFLQSCIGKLPLGSMEDCLRESMDKLYLLRERVYDNNGKCKKVERPLRRGEKEVANSIHEAMKEYDKHLEKFSININGVNIPELFFYRTFIQDFEHGGRLSCATIQNKPKKERLTLLIDGDPTVSLDFWAMHYCIAAELENWELGDYDPYNAAVSPYVDWYEVIQHENKYNLKEYNPIRNFYKLIVLTCLNAKDKTSALKGISNSLLKDSKRKDESTKKFIGLSCVNRLEKIVDSVLEHNTKISEYFNSDFGIKAQYYESQIAQYCVDRFREMNKVCIPVHDSITVKATDMELGLEVMEEGYRKVLGSTYNCRIEVESL